MPINSGLGARGMSHGQRALEVITDEDAQHWSFPGPQSCLHLDECFVFMCARKNIEASFVVEIAETGSTAAGALIEEVERWSHAEVRSPLTVKRRPEAIGCFRVHTKKVRQLSEAKFDVGAE